MGILKLNILESMQELNYIARINHKIYILREGDLIEKNNI